MKPQLQTVSIADRLCAIVPLDDYDALREALEDAADAAAMRRSLADPEEETIPLASAERMFNGESPVRVWREHRGMKAGELAAAAGISRSCLSAIENGDERGSVAVLGRLADALGLRLDDLA